MSDMIKREDVLRIIEARFSKTMIGDILKQDINALPEAEMQIGGRQCKIDRCELFNRLATITAEDANEMKAKIYAVIQAMPAIPERVLQPVHVHIDTEEILEKIREEYELVDEPQGDGIIVRSNVPPFRIAEPQTIAEEINRRVEMVKKDWKARHIKDEPQTERSSKK